ncbi:unnamed protein product [Rhizopus stolonifer]
MEKIWKVFIQTRHGKDMLSSIYYKVNKENNNERLKFVQKKRLQAKNFKLSKGQKKILIKFNRYIQGEWSPDKEQHEQREQKKPPKDNTPKGLSDLINVINKTDNKYNLKIELEPSSFTKEKYELYKKYQIFVHHDEEEDVSSKGFCRFLVDSPLKFEKKSQTQYGSFHQKYILDGKLIALSVIDILPNCVSAVYFMYDPDYAFLGLGKYSALKETALTQELNQKAPSLQYYYMGFYIDSCPKMNYKGHYEPSDLLDPVDYSWHSIEKFKKELKKHQFVTFSKGSNNKKNGWLDSKEVTQQVLSTVDVYIGNGSKLPAKELLELINDSRIKEFLVDYVCAVGLKLASDMMISF